MLQKKANKHPKSKKNQPLKVVYITNPIKFTIGASEFRALAQELTGRDVDGGGGQAVKAADEMNAHAVVEACNGEVEHRGSVPTGLYDEDFVCLEMMESFQGLVGSNLVDVLKNLDPM